MSALIQSIKSVSQKASRIFNVQLNYALMAVVVVCMALILIRDQFVFADWVIFFIAFIVGIACTRGEKYARHIEKILLLVAIAFVEYAYLHPSNAHVDFAVLTSVVWLGGKVSAWNLYKGYQHPDIFTDPVIYTFIVSMFLYLSVLPGDPALHIIMWFSSLLLGVIMAIMFSTDIWFKPFTAIGYVIFALLVVLAYSQMSVMFITLMGIIGLTHTGIQTIKRFKPS